MKQKDSFWSKNKTFILLFVSVLTGIFVLRSILSIMARVPEENYRVLNHITVEVEDQQGKVETFDSHLFNFTSCQDKITMHIPLEKAWEKENQSINFFFYNSVVKAYYKDQLLATFGENLKRHMIGKLLVSIPVPPEAFGEEIRVEIFPKMHFMENNFDAPILINDRDAMFFTIVGQETSYALFVMTLIATFLGMVIFLFFSPRHIYAREGFWLMAMIFALTLWHLGNSGMLYKLSDDADLNAVGEYIGMYLLLPSAPIYASYETERPRVKKYLRIVGSISATIFVLTLVLYLLPTGYTYVWNLRWAQALQLVLCIQFDLPRQGDKEQFRPYPGERTCRCGFTGRFGTAAVDSLCECDRQVAVLYADLCENPFLQGPDYRDGFRLHYVLFLQAHSDFAEKSGRRTLTGSRFFRQPDLAWKSAVSSEKARSDG